MIGLHVPRSQARTGKATSLWREAIDTSGSPSRYHQVCAQTANARIPRGGTLLRNSFRIVAMVLVAGCTRPESSSPAPTATLAEAPVAHAATALEAPLPA